MSIVVLRQKSLHFDLSPAECETPHLKLLLFEKLQQMYEGTCMDSSYILKIMRIIGEPAPRVWNPRKMNGEMQTSIIFEYQAEILMEQSEVKTQCILHNGNVVAVSAMAETNEVLATCSFGDHITGTILVENHGIVNVGMTIPVRVSTAEYQQNAMNNITIMGELLKPTHFNARYFFVSPSTDADFIEARKQMGKLDKEIAAIMTSYKRAVYFKALLHLYKSATQFKAQTLLSLLQKRKTKAMFVMINDSCDITNLEFIAISKKTPIEVMSFITFTETLIAEARRVWQDIQKLSETYDNDTVFSEHKTIWNYYDHNKFDELPDVSEKLPESEKKANNGK